MNKPYILSKGASADLEEIIRYGLERWGEERCMIYVGQLEEAATTLAAGKGSFKDLSAIHPQLRVARCGRHYIFCQPRPNAAPVILAILHDRMDIVTRLGNRLL